ncbi:MAG TPA: CPBP family intramembrane glutamic endopeptidase [Polyangiaceae bacterium]|nr:CPBP family intramembrane glutamic endopeptidase [Polyangiaceae bacterium]
MSEDQPPSFTRFDAVLWSAGVTFAFLLTASAFFERGEDVDVVKFIGIQVAVYLLACTLFSWRRAGRNFSEVFGLRGTSPWLFLLALLLGPALFGPVETLSRITEHFAPEPVKQTEAALAAMMPKSQLHAVLLFVGVAVGGPLAEELFFRGALYTALRPLFGAVSSVWTVTLCFTLCHPQPRNWLQILLPALVLSVVRAVSGSLWAGFCTHFSFNAAQLAALWVVKGKAVAVPLSFEIGGWALTLTVLGALLFVAKKSPRAAQARAVDEVAPPAATPDA